MPGGFPPPEVSLPRSGFKKPSPCTAQLRRLSAGSRPFFLGELAPERLIGNLGNFFRLPFDSRCEVKSAPYCASVRVDLRCDNLSSGEPLPDPSSEGVVEKRLPGGMFVVAPLVSLGTGFGSFALKPSRLVGGGGFDFYFYYIES